MAHFLTHGVTRERLKAQIRENGGYHIVHWSGHGHLNLLELAKAGGGSDRLSGQELLHLCGGFIPRLFFLGACHSGDILRVKDWKDFLAVAKGQGPGTKQAPDPATKDVPLDEQPRYRAPPASCSRAASRLWSPCGTPWATNMPASWASSSTAPARPRSAEERRRCADDGPAVATRSKEAQVCPVCRLRSRHARTLRRGAAGVDLAEGPRLALEPRNTRLHAIAELTTAGHEHFVGRTWELAGLGADFIGSSGGAEVKPVAVITGLGGMGKTALAAEALAPLGVAVRSGCCSTRPSRTPLASTATSCWNIHMSSIRLGKSTPTLRNAGQCRDAIWLPADGSFTGSRAHWTDALATSSL